jgi:2-polyprenyl-6-methoxyphenol hydroxylase-like FAD-dependent oxidoreductase
MKVAVIGAGPAGLYFGYLLKKARPDIDVVIFEQNAATATYGFGVTLADRALHHLHQADKASHDAIAAEMRFISDQRVRTERGALTLTLPAPVGSIGRLELLAILQRFARLEGVAIAFECRADLDAITGTFDLVVGADGGNSAVREFGADAFGTTRMDLSNRFAWYGVAKPFSHAALSFRAMRGGAFVAHYYPYSAAMSTFVAEVDGATWSSLGMAEMSPARVRELIEEVFRDDLDGASLVENRSIWRQFQVVRNTHWRSGRMVLIGDAARTIHFSIGSGTRIAMQDSIALASAISGADSLDEALTQFESDRLPRAATLLKASESSFHWYERFARHMRAPIETFVYNYLTRTGRVDHARLASEYPQFMQNIREDPASKP